MKLSKRENLGDIGGASSSQKEQVMDNRNKNPLLAGLMNVVLPGSSQLYVNHDWGRFAGAFVLGVAAFTAAIWGGSVVQTARGYTLPTGMCMGIMLMAIIMILFNSGQKTAKERNTQIKTAAYYNSKRTVPHETYEQRNVRTKKMRDEGLISEQEYKDKNAKVDLDE